RQIRKNAFIADEHAEPGALDRKQRLLRSGKQIAESFDHAVNEIAEQLARRNVLAERNQVDLVVVRDHLALRRNKVRPVERSVMPVALGDRRGSEQNRLARLSCQLE